MAESKIDWKAYGVAAAGSDRTVVVIRLLVGPATPGQLARSTGRNPNRISRALAELRNVGIVECMTPQLRKGRTFELTQMGKTIGVELEKAHMFTTLKEATRAIDDMKKRIE